jgi:hypothetical protein
MVPSRTCDEAASFDGVRGTMNPYLYATLCLAAVAIVLWRIDIAVRTNRWRHNNAYNDCRSW